MPQDALSNLVDAGRLSPDEANMCRRLILGGYNDKTVQKTLASHGIHGEEQKSIIRMVKQHAGRTQTCSG